ncbi:MAG: bifunctional diaminohydroxyphosphoribosylaminopyrimidine deaminase/5-amino-6-(5-phosphoribosylamino)uracil reductase RibD, partial [Bacteroidales bacterium]|nr:bifunctional diaminohydroxyphosphoribosylaminopyrimidine deaminase/5-amino-6-(5-phosphoribosylamino)uracil reductase RibD [Bacteroidales bacterium]
MSIDEKYMWRCLQLAKKGRATTKNNPMVGSVIVHNNKIIGEGYHRKMGEAHAEVNAIDSVRDHSLLKEATIYVSLEPCSHYGKTPPCAALIASKGVRRVVVAVKDPNEKVAGRGIKMLKDAGAEVTVGVLEAEAKELNRSFFVNQTEKRPFVILKWAQTKDGFIDNERGSRDLPPLKLSNSITQCIVHKLRSQSMGIMVGTNTAIKDNPTLNTRKWFGDNPVRIVLDRRGKLPADSNLFNDCAPTVVFTELSVYPIITNNVTSIQISFDDNMVAQMLLKLYELKIATLIVEGGSM